MRTKDNNWQYVFKKMQTIVSIEVLRLSESVLAEIRNIFILDNSTLLT